MNNLQPIKRMQLTPDQNELVARVADSLRKNDQVAAMKIWRQLVKSLGESSSRVSESDISDLVQQTMQQAGLGTNVAKATSPEVPDDKIKALEEKLNTVGDDAQLANVDLQNVLQKQQQTLQTMSNISKMLHETAMAVIRNMKG